MRRIASRFEDGFFGDLDLVRLRRKAKELRDEIFSKVDQQNDPYEFFTRTIPVLDAAIAGKIVHPFAPTDEPYLSGKFCRDRLEGDLPDELDHEFTKAVSGFSATARAFALERPVELIKDGLRFACLDVEEDGDWPNVKHQ